MYENFLAGNIYFLPVRGTSVTQEPYKTPRLINLWLKVKSFYCELPDQFYCLINSED